MYLVAAMRIGDYMLAGLHPDAAPNYQAANGRTSKTWACDHILELNTLDDFLNTPGDAYQVIKLLLSGTYPDSVSYCSQFRWQC
jgi:hypothetical protein